MLNSVLKMQQMKIQSEKPKRSINHIGETEKSIEVSNKKKGAPKFKLGDQGKI